MFKPVPTCRHSISNVKDVELREMTDLTKLDVKKIHQIGRHACMSPEPVDLPTEDLGSWISYLSREEMRK
jgi:hypothetical protein